MVAALTTSLPETPGGERNWDYRYTWIRDATFTLWSLHVLGFDQEARRVHGVRLATSSTGAGPRPQIMFGIGGETELTETTLDHLSGYVGSKPVRVGNAAYEQRQNDVYGALLDSIYIHSKTREGVPERAWRRSSSSRPRRRSQAWRAPDQGIWEARGEPQALRLLEADELGGARPRRPARARPRRAASWPTAGGPRRGGAGRDPRARGQRPRVSSASTTTPTRSTPRCS